jgi:branched-chain amino acid transport system substrate-binding protein
MTKLNKAFASTAVVLVLAALAACGRSSEKIYIGVAGPLSAANGRSMQLAAQMAVAEINQAGGIDGRQVELVLKDDGADPQRAIAVATELRNDPRIVAVVGHVNSAASLRAATIYNAQDGDGSPVLQISPASSAPALTQAGEWTFRVTPTDLEFSPVLARYARRLGRGRAVVLYANDDYGRGVRETFERAFRADGGAIISADPYLPAVLEQGTELDPYLMRAMGYGADALVIGGQAEAGVKIIQAARRLGYAGPILGSDGLTGVKDAGAVAEGVFVSSAFLPDRADQRARTFVESYRRRYNALPDHRGAMTYDILYLLRDAIQRGGTGRRALRDEVAGVGREGGAAAFDGVSGRIAFDENGDVRGKEVVVGMVRGGQLVTAR